MTRRVGPADQGKLQGALAGAIGISGMIGPILFGQVFAWALGPGAELGVPGAAFMVAAALVLVALILAWTTTRRAAA
jgi:DHA1 family tetracycline resistance protein-like MFS transporter